MKKTITLFLCLSLFLIGQAQVSKTVDVATAGTLSTLLNTFEKTTVTNLTVTGNIDARDVKCMRDEVTKLGVVDISTVTIKGYEGPNGTSPIALTYPDNEMPEYSFNNNNITTTGTLKAIMLPNSITSIGVRAFWGCNSLTNIIIPNSVATIKFVAFYYCTGLTNITIPNSVTLIQDAAFSYCSALTDLTIPNSVITMGKSVFDNCTGLVSITFPNSVASIGYNIFSSCTRLTSILVQSDNPAYSSLGGVLFNKVQTTLIMYPPGKRGAYSIPGTTTSIGKFSFSGCTYLTGITIPNSVTLIDSSAFNGCTRYIGVLNLPASLNYIGDYAFSNCSFSGNITIPDQVISIGNGAFSGCNYINGYVKISKSVLQIGKNAFLKCPTIQSFGVDPANPNYSDNLGVLFNKNQTTLIQFPSALYSNYVMPNTVDSIGNAAFYGITGLYGITFSNHLLSIGDFAFYNCIQLKTNTFPISLKSIGKNAFYNCTSLGNIAFPNSLETIGDFAFSSNSPQYPVLTGTIIIPASMTSIGIGSFINCSGLTSLIINNSVTSIGIIAFSNCIGLSSIYAYSAIPLELGINTYTSDNVFYGINITTCILYVPKGSKAAYQAAVQWQDFTNIVEMTTAVPALLDAKLSIYPNPVTISFQIKGIEGVYTVTLSDLNGKILLTKQVTGNENIGVNSLPKGMYIAKIMTGESTIERKIIKE